MADLLFTLPSKVVFSIRAVERIGIFASEFGSRVLLMVDDILSDMEQTQKVKSLLETKGLKCIVFDDIPLHATSKAVESAVSIAKASKSQLVIGMGGVRTLSIAKSTAKMLALDEPFDTYLSGEPFGPASLPYIEIPTTCRNPMMLTDRAIVVDARDRSVKKLTLNSYPEYIIIDPPLSVTLSAKYSVTAMLDTFLHSLEGYISTKSNFLSHLLFLESFPLLISNIRRAHEEPGNITIRQYACQAGLLSAFGLSMSFPGLGHAISHIISGKFRVPQAAVASILIPHIMEYGVRICPDKIEAVGESIGETSRSGRLESAKHLLEYMRHLIASLRLPLRLSDFSISYEQLIGTADMVSSFEGLSYLPEPVTTAEIVELLKQAY